MYKFDNKFIDNLFKDYSRSIVGELCKKIEILNSKDDNSSIKNLTEIQKFDILKAFMREHIYESFRDIKGQLKSYQEGKTFVKFNVYTPTDK